MHWNLLFQVSVNIYQATRNILHLKTVSIFRMNLIKELRLRILPDFYARTTTISREVKSYRVSD